jgi:undecaprenyl-diphosphatase
MTGKAVVFDTAVSTWFYSLRADWLTQPVKSITYLGNWQTVTLICVVLLFFRETRKKYGYAAAATVILVTRLNSTIKSIFQRPRPDVSLHLIEQGGYSFTSGHAITSWVFYGLLIYLIRKHVKSPPEKNLLTGLMILPMALIGLSRIYLGVHYPTDVLGAWLLGTALLVVVIVIYDMIYERSSKKG